MKRGLGLILFLLLVFSMNFISQLFSSETLSLGSLFLNENVGLIIVLTIILTAGELFLLFRFPLNLPGPAFNAAGSVLIVAFLFRTFAYLDTAVGMRIFGWLDVLSTALYILVPVIVLIVGYAGMIKSPHKSRRGKK